MRPSIAQVVAVLELLIRFHPAGMMLLVHDEPADDEVRDIIRSFGQGEDICVRVMGGAKLSQQEREVGMMDSVSWVIDAVGGWANIHLAAAEYRRTMGPDLWREITDYVIFIAPGGRIRDGAGGHGSKFFGPKGRHTVNMRTARRRFRELLRIIAAKAQAMYSFDLSADSMIGCPR